MRWSAIAVWLLFVTPGLCLAQETAAPKAWAEQYFGLMLNKGPDQAFRFLKRNSFIAKQNPAALKGIEGSLRAASSTYGAMLDFELTGEKNVGSSLLLLTYVVKHQFGPIIWELDFYKPGSRWNLLKFRFYDNLAKIPH